MLTTHFGETSIRKQEMWGIVADRLYIENIIINIFQVLCSVYAIFGQPYLRDHMCLNKREATQPEDASTENADFLLKWVLRGSLFNDMILYVLISLVFVKQMMYSLPFANHFPGYYKVIPKKKNTYLKCFPHTTQLYWPNGF